MKSDGKVIKNNKIRRHYVGCTHDHLYYFTVIRNDLLIPRFPTQVCDDLIQIHLPPQTQWQQHCSQRV